MKRGRLVMAFDGITVSALSEELSRRLKGATISKIAQPEKYELLFTIKGGDSEGPLYLFSSANASLPLLYLTTDKKKSPETAPAFCMAMRKYCQGGRILSVEQVGFERVIKLTLSHRGEMGDVEDFHLYFEIMGRHSNVILTDSQDVIIDAIKRITSLVSSVREVLPQKPYFIPHQEGKCSPLEMDEESFSKKVLTGNRTIEKAILDSFTGFGTLASSEIAARSGLSPDSFVESLSMNDKNALYSSFSSLLTELKEKRYSPAIYLSSSRLVSPEFSAIPLTCLSDMEIRSFDSVSSMLEAFYSGKNHEDNIRQKTESLRKTVETLLARDNKTLLLQEKQLDDTKKADKYRLYGELIHAFGYNLMGGESFLVANDYHTGEDVKIPLDKNLSAMENAKHYFKKYDKLKRTKESLVDRIKTTKENIEILSSILTSLSFSDDERDIAEIRQELYEQGYIKKSGVRKGQKKEKKASPLSFRTRDNFLIYVGKNNYQNEEVTFKLATGKDWWFHAKTIHGSHVILKTEGKEPSDEAFLAAAQLAAYFSEGRDQNKVEVDYVQKKEVKKTPGTKAGFVIYYTNYSMVVAPTLENVERLV
ncbi:MAG: NFACT family protein [Lachnospiraceae bacterium]|nr:NFACT family protein [Lachnospiraceae bacterium]